MKKIIALALALIMALSMGSVAFAAADYTYTAPICPGDKITVQVGGEWPAEKKAAVKIVSDFTSAEDEYKGASMVESIEWVKDAAASKAAGEPMYDLVLTIKENLTSTTSKDIAGEIQLVDKKTDRVVNEYLFDTAVANNVEYIAGDKKADSATELSNVEMAKNTVMFAEDGAGYVTFTDGDSLTGTVKVAKDEKAQVYFADYETDVAEDTQDAIAEYLGEDFEGIVEYIVLEGTGFKADADFRYDAYEEDPHFFYVWNGEAFEAIDAKYDADEDVDDYVFTAAAKGIILVSDVELVAAEEEATKNPDTGANDVVGVAAALAVVSLVAAGAVSLKK